MPPALTPKVPLTVVANQGTEEMATTVQVGVQLQTLFWLIFSLVSKYLLLQKKNYKDVQVNLFSELKSVYGPWKSLMFTK